MRTLFRSFVLFAIATAVLQSCSDNDNPSNPENGPLLDLKVGRTLEYLYITEAPQSNRIDTLFIRSVVDKDTSINNIKYFKVIDRFYESENKLDSTLLEQEVFLRVSSEGMHSFSSETNQEIHIYKFPMSLNERHVVSIASDTTVFIATQVNERITVQNVSYVATNLQVVDTTQLQLGPNFFIDAEIKQQHVLSRGFGLVKTQITITSIENPTVLASTRQELLRIRN